MLQKAGQFQYIFSGWWCVVFVFGVLLALCTLFGDLPYAGCGDSARIFLCFFVFVTDVVSTHRGRIVDFPIFSVAHWYS